MRIRKAYMSSKVPSLPPMTSEDKKFKKWLERMLWTTFDRVMIDDKITLCEKCVDNATRYISEKVRREIERREGI